MTDMLVKLYALPPLPELQEVTVRRALAAEKHVVIEWIQRHFNRGWANECELAFSRLPIACFVATHQANLIGFSCYEGTGKGVFGPVGVDASFRGRNLGRALTLSSLHDMKAQGYAYAVIGWVDDQEFYVTVAGAQPIPDSKPELGMYRDLLPGTFD